MPNDCKASNTYAPARRRNDKGFSVARSHLAVNGAQAFTNSAERVVQYLNAHTPLPDWSVSRVTQGEQIHVHVHHDQLLETGTRVDWNESFCSRMAAGAAHVVRDSRVDPNYNDLSAAASVGAYAGYTISDDRGELFGVLCGVRPNPLREGEHIDEELLELLTELLSSQLELSRAIDRSRRDISVAEALTNSDALTGLLNRRGWDNIVADAQERIDAFGDPVAVAFLDLDDLKMVNDTQGHAAGDELLVRTADALRAASTPASHIARYGGDEFVILANGVTPSQIEDTFEVFRTALAQAQVRASVGYAAAEPGRITIEEAIETADMMMYERKRAAKKHG